MPNSTIDRQELVARTDARHRIGTDATGAAHYYCNYLGTVWIVIDGDIERVEMARNLAKWKRFIAARRGWDDHCIDERSDAEFVADAVEDTMQGAV